MDSIAYKARQAWANNFARELKCFYGCSNLFVRTALMDRRLGQFADKAIACISKGGK